MADEIIEELWRIKDSIARDHAYSIDALVAHLQAKGLSFGHNVVDLGEMKHEQRSRSGQQPRLTT